MTLQSEQFDQTPPKYISSKSQNRRVLPSLNKTPYNNQSYSHYSSTECILSTMPKSMDPNITSSISSSIISSSTTSGFVSGSTSTTNSISSSKSNDFLNPHDFKKIINSEIKSGSVSSTRNLYENMSKNRISSYQADKKSQRSPNFRKMSDIQGSTNSLNNSSQYIIDPLSSSSRHASNNSTKCLNHGIITPRNSTSTMNNSRRESNNTLETQNSRRSSQINKKWGSNSNSNNKSFDDIDDDLDIAVNDYDEDDDIFDYKENSNDNLNNKQYHNSLSTASCLENEINCLNTYNITPDTSSSSASSSSFSPNIIKSKNFKSPLPSTPELPRGPRVVNNRQFKLSSPNAPLPPQLPTTTQSFFVQSTTDFTIQESLQNFSHFDAQSTYFSYKNVKSIISSLHLSMNIKTGASAASRVSSLDSLNRTLPPIPQVIVSKKVPEDKKTRLSTSLFQYDAALPPTSPRIKEDKPVFNLSTDSDNLELMRVNDLVEECPCFRLEVGGDSFKGLGLVQDVSQRRMMKLNSINILDKIHTQYKKDIIDLIEQNHNEPFTIEYQDYGAYFYRYFFSSQDHANYLGIDRNIGPVVISIRRDKLITDPNSRSNSTNLHTNCNERISDYAYRFILRTSDLNTLRGTILEEHISAKVTSSSKSLPHKEVIQFLMPELKLDCLRLADTKIAEKLIEIDEQYLIKNHKIGILLCKSGQSTEEEMYNNKESTPAFDEFLQLLGEKVHLNGFSHYRGGLDNQNDTTGTHSVYTKFRNKEIMFHVSTLLPYSNNDRQQLTRKRHIGNDLVTIIFQEPGSLPFSPKTIRSQYQHIFIIVRAMNPNSYNTQYSVAISYSKDIPSFGPALPKHPLFLKSKEFREFLLAKIINADNVGLKCEKFTQIRMRTRNGILKDLVDSYSSKFNLDNCSNGNTSLISQKLNLFNFGSIKQKKLRSKSCQAFNASLTSEDETNATRLCKLNGAIFWNVDIVEDFQYLIRNCCILGISKQNIIIVDSQQKCVLFSIGCNAVIGWTLYEHDSSFILYFDLGECLSIKLKSKSDLYSVVKRLENFTKGCKTIELSIEKKDCGPLGFNIHHDGVVTEVEKSSVAAFRGLKQGTRIVKIGDNFVINLSHERMIDLLRNSVFLKITFLQPFEDGSARRGQDDSFSLYAYLSTCSSINERQIDSIKTTPILTNFQKYPRYNLPQIALNSPQKNRRMTTTDYNNKNVYRLSTSGLINENMKSEDSSKNSSVYTNSLYYGMDDLNRKEIELTSVQSPKKILNNKNVFDWPRMVQTASRNFEKIHRGSDNVFFNENTLRNRLNSTSSSYYNIEDKKRPANLDLKECMEQNTEKNSSYDELRERLLYLQLELKKEKQEKNKIEKKEAQIREEYLNLQQEYIRVSEQLRYATPSTPTSRRFSTKNEFIDCASDLKQKQNATPQVLRLNHNDTFFPNHTYANLANDSHV